MGPVAGQFLEGREFKTRRAQGSYASLWVKTVRLADPSPKLPLVKIRGLHLNRSICDKITGTRLGKTSEKNQIQL